MLTLNQMPGLPAADLQPPTVAEAGDPFAELRVVHLVARLERATSVRVRDIVDRLNADYVDWSFTRGVVVAAVVQLQSNWQSDFRTTSGIEVRDGVAGPELIIEDTPRVGPWLVRQVTRLSAACTERLRVFALEEGAIP
ncbi:MAG: hypothetical protein LH650_05530 [Chloroflexi bacterium]|nr:hypothetical protein [Chloroflexota bacterium]